MVKIEKKHENTLLGGAFALTLSVVIVKIIGFIYKLPLSHILGDEGMGYFNSAYSIFAFFYMLCSGGVPKAVSITVTEASVRGNTSDVNKILSLSVKVFIGIGIVFTTALIFFSRFFANMIGNSLAAFSLVCIAPSLTFVAASGVLKGYLTGIRRLSVIAVSEVMEGVIKFIFGLLFALLAFRRNLPLHMVSAYTILGVTLGSLISMLFLIASLKITKPEEKTEQKYENSLDTKQIIGGIFKISIPITLSSAIMGISNIIDLGLIMKRLESAGFSNAEAVSLYGNFTTLAVPMLNLVIALINPLCTSAIPHLTTSFTSGNRNEFFEISERIVRLSAIVSMPLGFAYLFFSNEILLLLFKDNSAELAAPLLSLLAPAVIFMPLLTVVNTILESTFHQKAPLASMSAGAVIKIICGYILIGRLGIAGAPVSTSICYGASLLISSIYMLIKLKMNFSVFRVLFVPFIASFISVGGGYVMYNYFCPDSFKVLIFLVFAVISALLYSLLLCIFMRRELFLLFNFVKIAKKKEYSL